MVSYYYFTLINMYNCFFFNCISDGLTALHLAVKVNNLPMVALLCDNGANINEIERKAGRTCLHFAILDNSVTVLEYIVKHPKVDLSKRDFSGHFAQSLTISSSKDVSNIIYNALVRFIIFIET